MSADNSLNFFDLVVDSGRRMVIKQNQSIDLTRTEFDLLFFLIQQEGRVVSRNRLMEALRPERNNPYQRSVDVHIQRLRKKLGRGPDRKEYICTIRSIGYKANWPLERLQLAPLKSISQPP